MWTSRLQVHFFEEIYGHDATLEQVNTIYSGQLVDPFVTTTLYRMLDATAINGSYWFF